MDLIDGGGESFRRFCLEQTAEAKRRALTHTEDAEVGTQRAQRRETQEGGVKPPLHWRDGEEYNCGHGQQTDCTDIAGDRVTFAD